MKSKYFTIIVLFSTNLLLGRSYIPTLVKGNQWNVMYYDESFDPEHTRDTWETIKYKVGADIIIDGLNYIEDSNGDIVACGMAYNNTDTEPDTGLPDKNSTWNGFIKRLTPNGGKCRFHTGFCGFCSPQKYQQCST